MTPEPDESDPLTIDLAQLRRTFSIAVDELERITGPTVTLERDYFWSVPARERFNPYEKPATWTLGQLSELISHISALDSEPDQVINRHLVWLGELLQGIGESR